MKSKFIAIWLCVEIFLISILSELGVNFDIWPPFVKIIIAFMIILPICLLLYRLSRNNKVNYKFKFILWVIIIFFLICFILASITEIRINQGTLL